MTINQLLKRMIEGKLIIKKLFIQIRKEGIRRKKKVSKED